MAVTRLERKGKRNKSRAKNRVNRIKQLRATPVIKNVDVEEIKKSFEKAPAKKAAPKKEKAEKKEEAPQAAAETKTATEEAPKEAKAKKEEATKSDASDKKEDKSAE